MVFAEEICGLTLIPWQRWLLIHMLELDPALTVDTMNDRGPLDPLFRFRRVIILVARQNGKSTLSQVLALFFMYVLGTRMVLGTAQDLDTAEEVWQGAVDLIEEVDEDEEPVRPELHQELDKVVRRNGKRSLNLFGGIRYRVKAANRRAGRGLSAELAMLDELREHLTWEAWAAITKTTNARPSAMIVGLSNAGDAASVVLDYLRKAAHRALGDPDEICDDDLEVPDELLHELHDGEDWDGDDSDDLDEDTLGIFEWSAPPGCSKHDRDGWAQANPSLGYTISERTIAGDAASDPEWVFRTEVLCQWPDGAIHGPFEAGAWEAGKDPESRRASNARVDACVSVAHDRSRSYVTIASTRDDGTTHVEVVAERAGTEWVKPWFLDDSKPDRATWRITGQTNGAPVSSLMQELAEAGLTIIDWAGPDLGRAHGAFFDAVENRDDEDHWLPRVFHRPTSKLDAAAAAAITKPLGDGWVFDLRRSPVDVAPLQGAVGAYWLHDRPVDTTAEPRIRRIGARA